MKLAETRRGRLFSILRFVIGLSVVLFIGGHTAQARHQTSQAAASVTAAGGTITVRTANPLACLDPEVANGGSEYVVFTPVFDTLISEDTNGKFWPDLALRWKYSNGGKDFTLYLRKGVKFTNGDPFDATAAKASIERALSKKLNGPYATEEWGYLKKVTAVNKYTVRLHYDQPFRALVYNLSTTWTAMVDAKAMPIGSTSSCQKPIGTGLYKIASVAPSFSTVTLVRNPAHTWGVPFTQNHGPAYLSKMVFKDIDSDSSAVSALLAGQIDMVVGVPGSQLPRLKNQSNIKLYQTLAQDIHWIGFNLAHGPLKNANVRKGIAEAIDRNAVLKVAVNGLGTPLYSVLPTTVEYNDPKAKSYATQYNPSDAQKLLSAAHFTGPLTLLTQNDQPTEAEAQLVQSELENVGVKVNIVSKPFADWYSQAAKGDDDLYTASWGYGDASFLYSAFHSGQVDGKLMGTHDSFLDSNISKELIEVDPKAATKTLATIQKYIDTKNLAIPLWTDMDVNAVRTTISGYKWSADTYTPDFQDLKTAK